MNIAIDDSSRLTFGAIKIGDVFSLEGCGDDDNIYIKIGSKCASFNAFSLTSNGLDKISDTQFVKSINCKLVITR